MSDKANQLASSPRTIFPITPNDSTIISATGIVFKTAGALRILDGDGNERTIPSGVLAVGVIHRFKVTRVYSTDTTASDIWGVS